MAFRAFSNFSSIVMFCFLSVASTPFPERKAGCACTPMGAKKTSGRKSVTGRKSIESGAATAALLAARHGPAISAEGLP